MTQKMGKEQRTNKYFTEKDTQVTNMPMKGYSVSFVIMEMQSQNHNEILLHTLWKLTSISKAMEKK
jgi:hypothetical protein